MDLYTKINRIIDVVLTLTYKSTLRYIVCFLTCCNKMILLETRRGARCMVRFNSSDKGECIAILSGSEYGFMLDKITRNSTEKMVVLDVGANIGLFSIWLEKVCGVMGDKILVEPDPENLEFLKTNLSLNKMQTSRVVEKAVYTYKGYKNFSVMKDYHARHLTDENFGVIKVETDTLAGIIINEGIQNIDILKIDIEGGEWDLFNEENRGVFAKARICIIEYHADDSRNFECLTQYFRDCKITHFKKSQTMGIVCIENI